MSIDYKITPNKLGLAGPLGQDPMAKHFTDIEFTPGSPYPVNFRLFLTKETYAHGSTFEVDSHLDNGTLKIFRINADGTLQLA